MSNPELVIFDTDMGTDDAWALFMLLKAEKRYNLKLLGVTIVHGITSLECATENALRVLSAANRLDVRAYKGATEPLVKESKDNLYHGINGFGDVDFPTTPDLTRIDTENAVNYMYRMVKQDYRFNEIGNIKSCVTDVMNPVDAAIYLPKNRTHWNPCDAFLIAVFLEKVRVVKRSTDYFATVELNGEMTRGQVAIYHLSGSHANFNVTMIEAINADVCKQLLHWTASWTVDSPWLND